jgi:CHAP domain
VTTLSPTRPLAAPLTPRRPGRRRGRRFATFVLVVALVAIGVAADRYFSGPHISPLRARIVSIATSQVGYQTDPSDTYCNRYSAYWYAGIDDCGNSNLDEEWCADFAAWVWKQAGAVVEYKLAPGYLNSDSASFYVWGVDHGTWHSVASGYTPQPGDVAVYGLNLTNVTADHVAIVTSATSQHNAPDVINGDGDRTGYSVVETGTDQAFADVKGKGGRLSGYVSPSAPPGTTGS